MWRSCLGALAAAAVLAPRAALALPRFAARNGSECAQCHVNPSGGGVRNSYGSTVFAKVFLPLEPDEPASWLVADSAPSPGTIGEETSTGFSPQLTEWFTIGADFRTAYINIRPDRGAAGKPREITNTFFQMQGDLYHAARVTPNLTVVADIGLYSGFEAWGLYHLNSTTQPYDLFVKVGRFMPTFGIREVEHQLFTRERVGLGTSDRDTGLELTALLGQGAVSLALVNGTLGDTPFDNAGKKRHDFNKGLVSRASLRQEFGLLRAQVGASGYFTQNTTQANPLFSGLVPPTLSQQANEGADETRLGAFLTANLGRFTYLADLVWVRDAFNNSAVPEYRGYASYQELSFLPLQGLDLIGTMEFMDPDTEIAKNTVRRYGFVVELFPFRHTEVRAMVRRLTPDKKEAIPTWDAVLQAHFFL